MEVSKSKQNKTRVFQGGSLSCILYMIYANDLGLFIPDSVSMVQFADDTQLLITGKKRNIQAMVTQMEETLHALFNWFCCHGMKVNAQKTQMLVLGTPAMLRGLQPVQINFCGATVHESRVVNPRPAGGGRLNAPPSGFSRIAKKRRRAAPPGFHPPYPPSFPQLL